MNGPEHYAEAERILRRIERSELAADEVLAEASLAQVHAELAKAAATIAAAAALGEMLMREGTDELAPWFEAGVR